MFGWIFSPMKRIRAMVLSYFYPSVTTIAGLAYAFPIDFMFDRLSVLVHLDKGNLLIRFNIVICLNYHQSPLSKNRLLQRSNLTTLSL